jgi:hypothetical protein
MIIEFILDEQDLLTHQLFVASKSEQIKKRRNRSRLAAPIVQAGFGILFLVEHKYVPGIIFLCLAPIWYFVYPLWERKYYERNYRAFIRENQNGLANKTVSLEFTEESILAKDNGSEGKILFTEIASINEIPALILIRLKGGKAFIIPKNKLADQEALVGLLENLASRLNITYEVNKDWEWK